MKETRLGPLPSEILDRMEAILDAAYPKFLRAATDADFNEGGWNKGGWNEAAMERFADVVINAMTVADINAVIALGGYRSLRVSIFCCMDKDDYTTPQDESRKAKLQQRHAIGAS